MPDKRTHRGPGPEDQKLFCESELGKLRSAVVDFCMLLSRGYAERSSIKLVGDRFDLTQRQRLAVLRNGCSDEQLHSRGIREITIDEVGDRPVAIDGYNLLITIESAMGRGAIFVGRDGCYKDIASVHGTYRKVFETLPAIKLIGGFLQSKGIGDVLWLLDRPVSNSGRLKKIIEQIADQKSWRWQVDLSINPDKILIASKRIVVTTDSIVLDGCDQWLNLAGRIIESELCNSWVIAL